MTSFYENATISFIVTAPPLHPEIKHCSVCGEVLVGLKVRGADADPITWIHDNADMALRAEQADNMRSWMTDSHMSIERISRLSEFASSAAFCGIDFGCNMTHRISSFDGTVLQMTCDRCGSPVKALHSADFHPSEGPLLVHSDTVSHYCESLVLS